MLPVLEYYEMGPRVTAFSTTRKGGVSRGAYGEMNINRYCGDEPEAIRKNRERLCQTLDITTDRLIMPHQTHQTKVVEIDEALLTATPDEQEERLEGVDAVMTNVPGVCIGVSTADCIPVLLYDTVHQAVSAIHAGWRGTVARIVEKTVEEMTRVYASDPTQLVAQIGPGISLDSFEVGDEVYEAFQQAGFEMTVISRRYPTGNTEKWHIDLPECNRRQLLKAGLREEAIRCADICTYQQSERFFSARKLGIQSGRIFTGIILKSY